MGNVVFPATTQIGRRDNEPSGGSAPLRSQIAVAVGTPTDIVLMAIYTLVFNIVQGNFVAPLVYGKTVSLHPAIVLLAIPAGGQIAGVIGMFLIVPFLGVVAVTWRLVLHVFDPDDTPPVMEGPPPRVADTPQPASVPNAATS